MSDNLKQLGHDLHKEYFPQKQFVAGKDTIKVAGQWLDETDITSLLEAVVAGNYAESQKGFEFAKKLSDTNGGRRALLCNSGSSANLLAVTALMEKYPERKKVVTCATGFPTSANAVLQNGGELLFVDANRSTLNAQLWQVMDALTYDEVGGVILAHTLGFPFNEKIIYDKCKELGKWFVSDTCDAMGATINDFPVGFYSHANTFSFYPAHHLSCGEGGAVLTDSPSLMKIIRSYSEWGRSCYCDPGCDNTCGKRFTQQLGELPFGYDHKYSYERIGYNMKMSEFQAALGNSQIDHLPYFVRKRKENFNYLLQGINGLGGYFDTVSVDFPGVSSSPFGFPLVVREHTHINKTRAVRFLESRKIMTRPIFAGNLTRQPSYLAVKDKWSIRWVLSDSDYLMENAFWIGCHPGLTHPALDYMIENLYEFVSIVQGG